MTTWGVLLNAVISISMPSDVYSSRFILNTRGPLVGLVGQRYSIRAITFCGALVTTLGASLCALVSDIFWLTVIWGGLHGVGFAFTNTLGQVIVNQYFKKHRATASGIALSGACVSALIFPFMIEKIVSKYSLSGGFLILGGIILQVLPPSLFLRPPPWTKKSLTGNPIQKADNTPNPKDGMAPHENNETGQEKATQVFHINTNQSSDIPKDIGCLKAVTVKSLASDAKPKTPSDEKAEVLSKATNHLLTASLWSIAKLIKNPFYVLISIGLANYVMIYIPLQTVIVDYSKDKGISESNGKYLINSMAAGDLIGRLCFGWVTDRRFITMPRFFVLTSVLQGIVIALLPFAMNFTSFMVLLWLYGVVSGSMLVLFPLLVLKYVSEDQQPIAMGCVSFLGAVLSFGQPRLIGHFRDDIGSYDGLFYLVGCVSFLTGGLWCLEPLLTRRQLTKNEQRTTTS